MINQIKRITLMKSEMKNIARFECTMKKDVCKECWMNRRYNVNEFSI